VKYLAASALAVALMVVVITLVLRGSAGSTDVFDQVETPLQDLSTVPARTGSVSGDQLSSQELAAFVFDDAQAVAAGRFSQAGRPFQPAQLVLHPGAVRSACGAVGAGTGPFYCPADLRVYVDVPFMERLAAFGAPGDMAQAYVVAHEVGHHVQGQLGILDQVQDLQARYPDDANELNVRLELQADCLAGVWASSVRDRGLLEEGDIEEGLRAAASVGDDRIQQETIGTVIPDQFTHGTSEQRQRWFLTGFEGGDPAACDTFSGDV
jgi:predicted metalloprotease